MELFVTFSLRHCHIFLSNEALQQDLPEEPLLPPTPCTKSVVWLVALLQLFPVCRSSSKHLKET